MVELFNTVYDDYIEYKHYINILENLKGNGNILSQFKETNDLEKNYQRKIKSLRRKCWESKNWKLKISWRNCQLFKNYWGLLSKGHSSTQNNEHHSQSQIRDLQWGYQKYNKNIRIIRKQQSKQIYHHQQTQVMSGNTSYADMIKKGNNFTIFDDSIIGGVKWNKMNKHSKGNTHLKTFKGATCKDMLSYVQPILDTSKFDGIIIHVETNVSAKRRRPSDIADSIISAGKKCWDTGVMNVMISSLVCRKSPRLQAKINEVTVLRDLWTIDGFIFIDNTNLSDYDICEDLLHLSYSGICKLANNFIGAINKNLEKSSFWQSSVSTSKNGSVSTSEKYPEKSIMYNGINWLITINLLEIKIDYSSNQQFHIEGFCLPYRLDNNKHGGGVLVYRGGYSQ